MALRAIITLTSILCVYLSNAQDLTYNELMNELRELRQTVKIIVIEMNGQRSEIKSQKNEIEALKQVVSSQEIELVTVKRELDEIKNDRNQGKAGKNILGDKKTENMTGNLTLSEVTNTKQNGEKDKSMVRHGRLLIIPKQENTEKIAFYAYMSAAMTNVGGHHQLTFDVVKTNDGNAFHQSTGVFMVPENGLYVFTWSFRILENSAHGVELAVNGQQAGVVYSATGSVSHQSGTSATIVIHANEGDDIYLRTVSDNNVGNIYSDAYGRTYFAGWKL